MVSWLWHGSKVLIIIVYVIFNVKYQSMFGIKLLKIPSSPSCTKKSVTEFLGSVWCSSSHMYVCSKGETPPPPLSLSLQWSSVVSQSISDTKQSKNVHIYTLLTSGVQPEGSTRCNCILCVLQSFEVNFQGESCHIANKTYNVPMLEAYFIWVVYGIDCTIKISKLQYVGKIKQFSDRFMGMARIKIHLG